MYFKSKLALSTLAGLSLFSTTALAQQDLSKVEISTTEVAENLYMLNGAGGNIGVSVGDDGVFIIDDQFAPLSEKIMAAIGELSDKPVSYVINTHWHFDHTGGNENFGKSGAVIVAHENVRERMSTTQFMKAFNRAVEPSPDIALPVITFNENVNFYYNDTQIQVMHSPSAHTDGDAMVFFTESNVLHMGDTFFNGFFPFIDQSSGGSLDGVIAAAEKVLAMVDDDVSIIPGHGPLSNKADLNNYLTMLLEVKAAMAPMITAEKSREEVLAANPLGEIGKTWGNGFMKTDVFTGIVFDVMTSN